MKAVPRILIAAPKSGTGKTTVVCGLLQALANRQLQCAAFKCGPDYIDPLFHEQLVNARRGNLDLFFTDEPTVRSLLVRGAQGCDISVIEGVMGFYDGMSTTSTQGSSYHLARATNTPVVLVLDAKGAALSLVASIKGMCTFVDDANICGVILNRCSQTVFDDLSDIVQRECGVPLLGYVPTDARFGIESRHLGLVTASEIDDLKQRIDLLAETLESTVDIDALIELATSAPEVEADPYNVSYHAQHPVRLAIAQDQSFCFYYAENLRSLTDAGVELVPFSPTASTELPSDIDGIYIGGGYPELVASDLAANESLRTQIRKSIASGVPTVAECGGFLYLQEQLADHEGSFWPMVGALPGQSENLHKLKQFGYITATSERPGLYGPAGTSVRAHEFHYWHSTNNGADYTAVKPISGRSWPCMTTNETLVAGFPHVYWPGNPDAFAHFVAAMDAHYEQRMDASSAHPDASTSTAACSPAHLENAGERL